MKELIKKEDKFYQKPIEPVITKSTIITEKKGLKINIKKSYQKMKKLGAFNESLLVYETIKTSKSYIDNYDKVIIPRNHNNNISLVFEINNDFSLFENINKILEENNVVGNLLNSTFNIDNTNFKNILSTDYDNNTDYCLTFNIKIKNDCIDHKKYTILSRENIITTNFLNNTKKAINNHNNIIIYRFNINNLNNLNIIIKTLKNNTQNLTSIDTILES